MRPSIPLASLLLALLAAGCAGRSLGPGDVSGAYGLLRYDDDSLPRTYTTDIGCQVQVEYGSLSLRADGTFELHIVRVQACANVGTYWPNIDASGTYGKVGGSWLGLEDPVAGVSYLAWLKGTHVVVLVPQVPLIGGGAVEVEFAAGAGGGGNQTVTIEIGNGPAPFVPIDSGVIVTKRP